MLINKLNIIIQLRWAALLGVLALLAISLAAHIYPISKYSWYAVALFFLTNLTIKLAQKYITERFFDITITSLILFDLVYLTFLLLTNGGAHNPFAILFIGITSAAAMTVSREYLLIIILTSLACLWQIYNGNIVDTHNHEMGDFRFHLQGMWLANSLGVIVVTLWIYLLRIKNEKSALNHQNSQRILGEIEKVESMGRMLASTAHQLGTPLATLQLGVSELTNKEKPLNETETSQWLNDLQTAVDQINKIFTNIKNKQTDSSKPIKIIEMSSYLRAIANRWAVVRGTRIHFQSNLENLNIKSNVLEEIGASLESLLENAFEAKSRKNSLNIQINLNRIGAMISLAVLDNGIGMDAKTLAKASEPLFTTKKSGTGLGLYICHQLATKLGGSINIDSNTDKGTTVTVTFSEEMLR